MKRSKVGDSQILAVLKQAEGGVPPLLATLAVLEQQIRSYDKEVERLIAPSGQSCA